MKKIINWIRGAVLGSLGKGYSAIMVGNLFHPLSAISKLIAEEDEEGMPRYVSKVYDAILDEENKISLWPAHWPWERLMRKLHDVGTYTFNKEMRNKVGTEDSPFPEDTVTFHDRIEIIRLPLIYATGVDPASTANSKSDFRSVVTWGLERMQMKFHCMHAWIKRRSIGEFFAAAYAQNDMYPGRVIVEENMLKEFLHEAIQNYAKQVGRYLPWQPITHTTSKIDSRIVGTCEYLWEHKKMSFEKNHSDQKTLIEQFVYILNPTVHDDGPDASEMAISYLQKGAGGFEYQTTGTQHVTSGSAMSSYIGG